MAEVKIAEVPPPPYEGELPPVYEGEEGVWRNRCAEKDREIQRLKEIVKKLEKKILKTKSVVNQNTYFGDSTLLYNNGDLITAIYEEEN